jgi:hypothetical protein
MGRLHAHGRKLVQHRRQQLAVAADWGSIMAKPKERHTVAFMVGAILGGAAGAVYGLLNASRPGEATRADLTERWHDVEERAAQEIAQFEVEVSDRVADRVAGLAPHVDVTIGGTAPGR